MVNLIKADLYKELKKKSFKYLVLLIIFVSVLSLVIINKNIKLDKKFNSVYPLFSEEEYVDVNKYGSYEQYKKNYESYQDVVNRENNIVKKNNLTNSQYLFSYAHNFIFVLGILIVFISFHSFSYDYQKEVLKYVFQTKHGRGKIYFSKLLSVFVISFVLFLLLILVMCITIMLLTHENIFIIKSYIYSGGSIKKVLFILDFLKNSFLCLIPIYFVIVFSVFLSILFKGNSFGLVIDVIIYFGSLVLSQLLFDFGFKFIEYTFLPYIDFTYFSDNSMVAFNNLIYGIDISRVNSYYIFMLYSLVFVVLSIKLLKRDV